MMTGINVQQPPLTSFKAPVANHDGTAGKQHASAQVGDTVSLHRPEQMSEQEIADTMHTIEQSLSDNPLEMMSAHGGFDYNRVMSLLSDPV